MWKEIFAGCCGFAVVLLAVLPLVSVWRAPDLLEACKTQENYSSEAKFDNTCLAIIDKEILHLPVSLVSAMTGADSVVVGALKLVVEHPVATCSILFFGFMFVDYLATLAGM